MGNRAATTKDARRSFFEAWAINPAADGPVRQPMSPAMAKRAKVRTEGGSFFVARLYVPGHIMPTESPQSAQPTKDSAGKGDMAAIR